GRANEDLFQQRLAVEQRRFAQIEAFAIAKIEGVVEHAVLPALAQIGLQIAQAGFAVIVLDHDLAVDESGAQAQRKQRLLDALEALGPIKAGAGEQLDLVAVDAGLDAIAVVLDLV